MKLYFVDAFAERKLSGNPAPVVCDADALSAADKQRIARELNASETVFVSGSEVADFKVQFFTPRHEVDLCGHGTVGAFWVLASTGRLGAPRRAGEVVQVRQETRAGVLPVDIHYSPDGKLRKVMMHQQAPVYQAPSLDHELIADILKIPADELLDDPPILNVSTGRAKLMVPVRSQAVLQAVAPDFGRMADLCTKLGSNGFHVFTFDTRHVESITAARHFAPTAGVNEDLVTGIAAGALGCYLVRYCPGRVPCQDRHSFLMEQGYNFGRESRVYVDVDQSADTITSVRVGGTAVILFEAPFSLDEAG